MEHRVREIMADILEVEADEIGDTFGPDSTENWDSLRNLHLITELESEFGINLTMDEIQGMVTFSRIVEVIQSHCG